MGFVSGKINTHIFRRFGFKIARHEPPAIIKTLNNFNFETVIDVGANTGQYGKKIRKAGYSGTIISFEPISSAYLKLLETSKSDPKWLVHKRSAIGNINGTSEIQVSSNAVIAPGASVGDFQVFGMGSLISGVYNSSFQLHLSKKAIPTRSLLPSSRFFDVFDD